MNAVADGALEPPLGAWRRLALLLLAWALHALAGPGALTESGTPALGIVAIAVWGVVVARPGRRAFLVEWTAASAGFAVQLEWIRYVSPPSLVFAALGTGLYAALGGPLVRRLAARALPFPLAVAAAWTFAETLRSTSPPPIGLGWLRLGHLAVPWPAVLEGARVVSLVGLTFALASVAGLAAFVARLRFAQARGEDPARYGRLDGAAVACGLVPLAVTVACAVAVPVPPTQPGPRLLLVQPNVPQARKMEPRSALDLFLDQADVTSRALEDIAQRGERAPDLVAWAETMLPLEILEPDARDGVARGVPFPPWRDDDVPVAAIATRMERAEQNVVRGELFGRILPRDTAFLSGVESWAVHGGELRRRNSVALWTIGGAGRTVASKRYLVPAAEGMMGLERIGLVRSTIRPIAGYLPDFVPPPETGVLTLATARGAEYPFGASVCFDNAFLAPYVQPMRRERVDFHLVVSNEAWYLEAWELDQMVAFSRVAAVITGRPFVRVTNSGVTTWIGADGREGERLRAEGRDRLVEGALVVDVPVPIRDANGRAPIPPAVWLTPWWHGAGLVLAPLLLLRRRRAQPGA